MSLILKTDLRILLRQDYKDTRVARVQEVYRDPHGNVIRFSVMLHSDPKNRGTDYAFAENLVGGQWHNLVTMFHGNLPVETGAAMTWLLTAVGVILDWPVGVILDWPRAEEST